MSVDSVGLLAQQSYTQIQDRPKLDVAETPMSRAVSFQDTVERQFNSFANMSPDQILSRIQGAKQASGAGFAGAASAAAASNGLSSGIVGNTVKAIRSSVSKHEQTARKSLIGEASLIELLTATTEAKNTMEATVKVRDKFLEAFDKVMNMSM
ncbi:MAG: flagellar hook-basal body complex protein FliE [Pseudomonadota bacterium]